MERDDGVALPVIEAHCDYRQPARYDDDLTITTTATLLTPVRVRFDYEVQRAPGQTPLAVGYTVHASVSAAGKPVRLPARVRRLLQDPPEPA
jgi:acyl-CoA thioester hydrolase